MRVETSVMPPGATPTMMVIGRAGKSCACAAPANQASATAAAAASRRTPMLAMAFLPVLLAGDCDRRAQNANGGAVAGAAVKKLPRAS